MAEIIVSFLVGGVFGCLATCLIAAGRRDDGDE